MYTGAALFVRSFLCCFGCLLVCLGGLGLLIFVGYGVFLIPCFVKFMWKGTREVVPYAKTL